MLQVFPLKENHRLIRDIGVAEETNALRTAFSASATVLLENRLPIFIVHNVMVDKTACRASVASSFLPLSPAAWLWRSLHHIAHATPRHWRYLLLRLRNYYISDDDETGDGGRILERASRNHRRVDDACRNQVLVLTGESVEADRITLSSDPVYHNRGVGPSVLSDLADRLLKCSVDDPGAAALVAIEGAEEVAHGLLSMQQRNPTARHDALFEGCPRRTQSIFDTVLLLLELCLGCSTHLDNGNTAS